MKTTILLLLSLGGQNYPQMVSNTRIAVRKVKQHVKRAAKKVTGKDHRKQAPAPAPAPTPSSVPAADSDALQKR